MTLQPGIVKCMMFDLDGTLIDSIPPYFRLLEAIFDAIGLPQPAVALKKEFIGIGPSVFTKMIPPERKHETDALVRSCMRVGRQLSQNMFRDAVSVFPGVGSFSICFGFMASRSPLSAPPNDNSSSESSSHWPK
nr:HAD hydrolase-like protein [Desulfosarcina cetonica]